VRCTNTGISAFIDPVGRVAARGNQFRAESLSLAIAPQDGRTVFHRIYSWLSFAIYSLTGLSFVWIGLRARKQSKG
jgi:apolipoprotein N-acyltransferase